MELPPVEEGRPEGGVMSGRLLVVCDDLFFWARIHGAAKARGRLASRVGDEPGMERAFADGGVTTVLADLGSTGVDLWSWAARWKESPEPPRLVGFVSHVDALAQERARRAGFDVVLSRSRFTETLADWV